MPQDTVCSFVLVYFQFLSQKGYKLNISRYLKHYNIISFIKNSAHTISCWLTKSLSAKLNQLTRFNNFKYSISKINLLWKVVLFKINFCNTFKHQNLTYRPYTNSNHKASFKTIRLIATSVAIKRNYKNSYIVDGLPLVLTHTAGMQ